MSARIVEVHLDQQGPVGRLWSRWRQGRESASFEYFPGWLDSPQRFSLEPALPLTAGPLHTGPGQALFSALGDSAPDRWGRALMRRAHRREAQAQGQAPRTLGELDYLLMVDDEARQGALRFCEDSDGPYLASNPEGRIPPLVFLPRLLQASDRFLSDDDGDEDLGLLLAPGSSLGGARPKASVLDQDGTLSIAKFPAPSDDIRQVLWEAVALRLAQGAGLEIPQWRLVEVAGRQVLLSRRFDRAKDGRVPFISAMSMLGARDNEVRSYLELADALHQHGSRPGQDMAELWRRVVFNVLISNTDDHLRNHGFLHGRGGWRLSPAYDLNPVPTDLKPRVLSTAIDTDDPTASLDLALEVAEYFRLPAARAREVAREVADAVKGWREVAESLGLSRSESERMSSAFEHQDLVRARAL